VLYRLSTTIAEEPRQKKIHVYALQLIADSGQEMDLCSREWDRIRIVLHGTGTGVGQLLAGMGGSGTGELVPCNTLVLMLIGLFSLIFLLMSVTPVQ